MGIFDGCLLACDIDGTLMDNGFINPRNLEKIEYFFEEGGMFSLSTGRTVGAVSDVLNKIYNISPSVVANGCMIYDFKNKKILYEINVPKNDLEIIKYVIENYSDIGIEVHSGVNVYTINATNETNLHQTYESLSTVMASYDEIKNLKINKVLFTFSSAEQKEIFKKKLFKEDVYKNCASSFIDTCAMINGELQNYYELVPNGVSKASALDKLCDILGIKKGCYFGIGDYYNDLEMIKSADIGATILDAPDDIKMYAEFVAGSCKDGAVADFIEYLTGKFSAK